MFPNVHMLNSCPLRTNVYGRLSFVPLNIFSDFLFVMESENHSKTLGESYIEEVLRARFNKKERERLREETIVHLRLFCTRK